MNEVTDWRLMARLYTRDASRSRSKVNRRVAMSASIMEAGLSTRLDGGFAVPVCLGEDGPLPFQAADPGGKVLVAGEYLFYELVKAAV